MQLLTGKYFLYAGLLAGVFHGFVACGSQLYRVSLEGDDQDDRQVASQQGVAEAPVKNAVPGVHAPNGWKALPISFRIGSDFSLDQSLALRRAMATWEKAIGRAIFDYRGVHGKVTGDSFTDLYSSLRDMVNGHYLDTNWTKVGKPSAVLATTIWDYVRDDVTRIETADTRFNVEMYMIGDSLKLISDGKHEVVDMESLALHELGHLLGLTHVDYKEDSNSVMNPAVFIGEGLANRRLSRGDVFRIQSVYGCVATSCDVDATVAAIEYAEAGSLVKR